jgi:hypothetical protein
VLNQPVEAAGDVDGGGIGVGEADERDGEA